MKIALVILSADPARGGAEHYTVDLAAALAQRGHDVKLVATEFAQVPKKVERVDLAAVGATKVSQYRSMLNALDRYVAAERFDIVHAMLPVRSCDIYHPHAGLAAGKREETGWRLWFNQRRRVMAEVESTLLGRADPPILLSLSQYVNKDVLRHYPSLPPDKISPLFNAVALHYFDPDNNQERENMRNGRGISKDDVVALIVAQDFERKGVPQAIRAVQQINRMGLGRRLKLIVVGNHKAEIDGDIIFAGISWKMVWYYSAADFFVLPTRHDPCSLVVLEALAMGLPVISTKFNGATEIMTDGLHGFVLEDPNDIDTLANAMRKLLDPDVRREMSQACLELRPELSYEHHLNQLLRIYETAIQRRKS